MSGLTPKLLGGHLVALTLLAAVDLHGVSACLHSQLPPYSGLWSGSAAATPHLMWKGFRTDFRLLRCQDPVAQ